MKLMVKLDPTIGQIIRKIKIKLSNLFYHSFKKPIINWIDKKDKERKLKSLQLEFKRAFGITTERVKELMLKSDTVNPNGRTITKMTNTQYKTFLNEELIKSARSSNEAKQYIKSSVFYEPEITDIHNESIADRKRMPLSEIIKKDIVDSNISLKKQELIHPPLAVYKKSRYIPPKSVDTIKIFDNGGNGNINITYNNPENDMFGDKMTNNVLTNQIRLFNGIRENQESSKSKI